MKPLRVTTGLVAIPAYCSQVFPNASLQSRTKIRAKLLRVFFFFNDYKIYSRSVFNLVFTVSQTTGICFRLYFATE